MRAASGPAERLLPECGQRPRGSRIQPGRTLSALRQSLRPGLLNKERGRLAGNRSALSSVMTTAGGRRMVATTSLAQAFEKDGYLAGLKVMDQAGAETV